MGDGTCSQLLFYKGGQVFDRQPKNPANSWKPGDRIGVAVEIVELEEKEEDSKSPKNKAQPKASGQEKKSSGGKQPESLPAPGSPSKQESKKEPVKKRKVSLRFSRNGNWEAKNRPSQGGD